MLDGTRRNVDVSHGMRPGNLACYCLDAPHDNLLILSWSRTLVEAVWYKLKYHGTGIDGKWYFLRLHNPELFTGTPEKRAKLYVRVLGRWMKFEPCMAILVLMSPLSAYASRISIEESLG